MIRLFHLKIKGKWPQDLRLKAHGFAVLRPYSFRDDPREEEQHRAQNATPAFNAGMYEEIAVFTEEFFPRAGLANCVQFLARLRIGWSKGCPQGVTYAEGVTPTEIFPIRETRAGDIIQYEDRFFVVGNKVLTAIKVPDMYAEKSAEEETEIEQSSPAL